MLEPAIVHTAAELIQAVLDGAIHLELRDHIDLTEATPLNNDEHPVHIADKAPNIESIRVCCTPTRAFVF